MSRVSDLDELLPPYRRAVATLLDRMRAAGHEPLLHETYRSPERAAQLEQTGKGIALSMHTLRIASDTICGRHKWDCGKHGCDFYQRLGVESERLGMTWGGRWERRDLVHTQAVPVAEQDAARRATLPELEAIVGRHLK